MHPRNARLRSRNRKDRAGLVDLGRTAKSFTTSCFTNNVLGRLEWRTVLARPTRSMKSPPSPVAKSYQRPSLLIVKEPVCEQREGVIGSCTHHLPTASSSTSRHALDQ